MIQHFFNKMFGISREEPLTKVEHFTFVCAILAYFTGGFTMMLVPDLWSVIFGFDLNGGVRRGYFFLLAEGLTILGIMYVVSTRGKSREVPGQGTILSTVFVRVVYVNWLLFSLYNNSLVPFKFALFFSVLDTSLALITYVIWKNENKMAGLKRFFTEIWLVFSPWSVFQRKSAFIFLQLIGFLQIIIGQVAPPVLISSGIVSVGILGTHTEGLFLVFFVLFKLHGVFHVLAGGDCNYSFLMFALFYRIVWRIPFFLFAGFTAMIVPGLATFFVLFDACYCAIISILLLFHQKSTTKIN